MSTEQILLDLALMFVIAKAAGGLFERVRAPAVIGELLAGVLIGPHLFGLVGHSEAHAVFQELGAIVLLFAVGLDTPLSDLRAVGRLSLGVGLAGIAIPMLLGVGLMALIGRSGEEALFVGTALVATSVGITARVLADLDKIRAPESRVILGAAIIDDIIGLLVLAAVVGLTAEEISIGSLLSVALLAVTFVVLTGGLGPRLVARATPVLDRLGELSVFTIALGICLVLSAIAGALDLAAIIGAFLAGMAFAETRDRYHLEERLASVYSFLVPFFFVITGTLVDLSVFMRSETLLLAAAVIVLAVIGKLGGCGLAAASLGKKSAFIVGIGMVPRGEVGIIVASIGLTQGILDSDLYGVIVAMSVVTTLIVPPVLAVLLRRPPTPAERKKRSEEIEGVGG
jgi:Kef-type K+ transport system membrane component KefB